MKSGKFPFIPSLGVFMMKCHRTSTVFRVAAEPLLGLGTLSPCHRQLHLCPAGVSRGFARHALGWGRRSHTNQLWRGRKVLGDGRSCKVPQEEAGTRFRRVEGGEKAASAPRARCLLRPLPGALAGWGPAVLPWGTLTPLSWI